VVAIEAHGDQGVNRMLHQGCKELVTRAHNPLSRHKVSARQDAMTYLVRVRGLLVDGESRKQEVLDHIHTPDAVYIRQASNVPTLLICDI